MEYYGDAMEKKLRFMICEKSEECEYTIGSEQRKCPHNGKHARTEGCGIECETTGGHDGCLCVPYNEQPKTPVYSFEESILW